MLCCCCVHSCVCQCVASLRGLRFTFPPLILCVCACLYSQAVHVVNLCMFRVSFCMRLWTCCEPFRWLMALGALQLDWNACVGLIMVVCACLLTRCTGRQPWRRFTRFGTSRRIVA